MKRIAKLSLTGILAAITPWASTVGPDCYHYTATNNTNYVFQDISGSGVRILAGGDDVTATVNLGFSFNLYGTAYTAACVSVNGLIAFGGCNAGFTNSDLTGTAPKADLPTIAPLWTDLTFNSPGADGVYYRSTGTAPNRIFTVQWNNAAPLNSQAGLTFQTILSESGNSVVFQYRNVTVGSSTADSGRSATVGIRNTGGNANGCALQWSYKSPAITNGSAIRFAVASSAPAAADVSSQVKVVSSGLLYNRTTLQYTGTVTVTNTSAAAIARPIQIVFKSLTAGVTLLNPSGSVSAGPYLNMPGSGTLGAGQAVTVNVAFTNPSNGKISYSIATYSGGL